MAAISGFNGRMAQQTDDLASADRAAANPHTPFHIPADDLAARLDDVWASPADDGRVELVIRRPAVGEREVLDEAALDPAVGIVGDTWLERGSRHTPDGSAEPDRQLTLMNARVAALVAGTRERIPLAGDQVYVDLDLSFDNLPAGTRLAMGSAVVVVTEPPHTGCAKFTQRYGLAALRLINSPAGRAARFRGLNARVDVAGTVCPGDAVRKLA